MPGFAVGELGAVELVISGYTITYACLLLARLARSAIGTAVITQNIDGLHQKAAVPRITRQLLADVSARPHSPTSGL